MRNAKCEKGKRGNAEREMRSAKFEMRKLEVDVECSQTRHPQFAFHFDFRISPFRISNFEFPHFAFPISCFAFLHPVC